MRKPAQEMEGFFQIGFAVIYIAVVMGFYRGTGPELACLPVCLAAFAAVYVLTYRRGNLNLHLLTAAAVLWLPAVNYAVLLTNEVHHLFYACLLYTSDAADE